VRLGRRSPAVLVAWLLVERWPPEVGLLPLALEPLALESALGWLPEPELGLLPEPALAWQPGRGLVQRVALVQGPQLVQERQPVQELGLGLLPEPALAWQPGRGPALALRPVLLLASLLGLTQVWLSASVAHLFAFGMALWWELECPVLLQPLVLRLVLPLVLRLLPQQ
jgi:hypothetical protein